MNKHKIMLVDDEPDILDLLEKALNLEGFSNITKIDNGSCAVRKCREIQPDILILDIMLPDLDGYEVCKQIREFSHCPVLFLSSKNDELDKILGLAVGGDDYVTKPFSPKEIAYRVKAQLRRALLQEPMSTVTDSIKGKVWELLVEEREAAEYSRNFSVVNLHYENNICFYTISAKRPKDRMRDDMLVKYEFLKILRRRSTLIVMAASLLLTGFLFGLPVLQYQTYSQDGVIKGAAGIAWEKRLYADFSVPLSEAYVAETIREVQKLFENPDNIGYDGNERFLIGEAYWEGVATREKLLNLIANTYCPPNEIRGYNHLPELDTEDGIPFYQAMEGKIQAILDSPSRGLSEAQKAYWGRMAGKVATTLLLSAKMKSPYLVLIILVPVLFLPMFLTPTGTTGAYNLVLFLLPYRSTMPEFDKYISYQLGGLVLDALTVRAVLCAFLAVIMLPLARSGFRKHQVA